MESPEVKERSMVLRTTRERKSVEVRGWPGRSIESDV